MNDYQRILTVSRRVGWELDAVLGAGDRLDPTRPFLPEAFARVGTLDCLDRAEQLSLNQIRGSTYLSLFGLIERFILPFALEQVPVRIGADPFETQALLGFAQEESKHIQLFERFSQRFSEDLGAECAVVGPPEQIARDVLAHHPLGIALAVLQIEWMTQAHYVESVRDDESLDPLFRRLLHQHFLEESQHARLDELLVSSLASRASRAELRRGLDDYERICAALGGLLLQQVELDLESLQRRSGRQLRAEERETVRDQQRLAYRETFHDCGRRHPRFAAVLSELTRRAL